VPRSDLPVTIQNWTYGPATKADRRVSVRSPILCRGIFADLPTVAAEPRYGAHVPLARRIQNYHDNTSKPEVHRQV
jgi:hypothetical protein